MDIGEQYLFIRISKNRTKLLAPKTYAVDANTPRGEDARYFELKPYGGKRQFYYEDIIARGQDAIDRASLDAARKGGAI